MIVGFCGPARCGKDTAAQGLLNFTRFAFADPLKRQVKTMLSTAGIEIDFSDPTTKEQWRDMLVFWGAKRRALDPSYWIKKLVYEVAFKKHSLGDDLTITDVRYPNEVEWIKRHRGMVLRIHRPGVAPANEEETLSLSLVDTMGLPVLHNDGSIAQLHETVRDAVDSFRRT